MAVFEFNRGFIDRVIDKLRLDSKTHQRKVALASLNNLVEASPVDTGSLRAGFSAQTNPNVTTPFVKQAPGTRLPKPFYSLTDIPLLAKRGQPLYITTAVPYATAVNTLGNSTQAPKFYIEQALARAVRSSRI